MDQDRREAQLWAEEWRLKQRNKRIVMVVAAAAAIAAIAVMINFVSVRLARTTYSSAAEMRDALQGRFETDYTEDIVIEGDNITLTYYNESHYDIEYAERYGYSAMDDSVYEDVVEEWDYRHGVIKCKWMDKITVDKDGNLVYYSQTFRKTDNPPPTPIDPSELSLYQKGYNDSEADRDGAESDGETSSDDAAASGMTADEEAAMDAAQESREETQAAAEAAGIEAAAGADEV